MLGLNYLDKYYDCQNQLQIFNYFNLNRFNFHSQKVFTDCNVTLSKMYDKSKTGSMSQYLRILSETQLNVQFYAGDWDDIVPFTYVL